MRLPTRTPSGWHSYPGPDIPWQEPPFASQILYLTVKTPGALTPHHFAPGELCATPSLCCLIYGPAMARRDLPDLQLGDSSQLLNRNIDENEQCSVQSLSCVRSDTTRLSDLRYNRTPCTTVIYFLFPIPYYPFLAPPEVTRPMHSNPVQLQQRSHITVPIIRWPNQADYTPTNCVTAYLLPTHHGHSNTTFKEQLSSTLCMMTSSDHSLPSTSVGGKVVPPTPDSSLITDK